MKDFDDIIFELTNKSKERMKGYANERFEKRLPTPVTRIMFYKQHTSSSGQGEFDNPHLNTVEYIDEMHKQFGATNIQHKFGQRFLPFYSLHYNILFPLTFNVRLPIQIILRDQKKL